MIAIDTSSFIAFLRGDKDKDVEKVHICIEGAVLVLPPVVLSEILSDPKLPQNIQEVILGIPILNIKQGYWQRAGNTRAKLLSKGLKARLADTLIAQSCIDHRIPLITRDDDFRHFIEHCELKLY